ncbi:MAG TPA: AAA family ATPase, partial [Ktedonobacterales bacterium]|nr:AAA family ATPase [Ktedonobacterales bacterium]
MRNIVAITGRMGSGKTTAARALVAAIPRAARVAFARAVRIDVASLLRDQYYVGVPWEEDASCDWIDEHKADMRTLLQGLGEGVRQVVAEDYWINRLDEYLAELEYLQAPGQLFVVDDLRYENEAAWVRSQGGLIIRLCAPQWVRQARLGMA